MNPESSSAARTDISGKRLRPHSLTAFRAAMAVALLTSACNLSNQQADYPSHEPITDSEDPKNNPQKDREVRLALDRHDQESSDFGISLVDAVMLRAKMGLLPPPECVNTGWVELNGDGLLPSSMTIFRSCEQPFEFGELTYPGEGIVVKPDTRGRFPLPYEGASVGIKDGMPIIIYPYQGEEKEGDLVPSDREARQFSFIPFRRQGLLVPIIDEEGENMDTEDQPEETRE